MDIVPPPPPSMSSLAGLTDNMESLVLDFHTPMDVDDIDIKEESSDLESPKMGKGD